MKDVHYATTRRFTGNRPSCFDQPDEAGNITQFKTADSDQKISEGGLRLLGKYKQGHQGCPVVTVVTVVFNGEELLEETVRSVIEQTYDNVEYIIVDGGSTDSTVNIVKKYEHAIDYWVSEPDGGIYEAMNKAIDLASGQWINFMNCGDSFYSKEVLRCVFDRKNYGNAKIIFGNHEVIYPSGRHRLASAGAPEKLWKGSQFCHQAAFVDVSTHKRRKFNICTKIVADFEFFYNSMVEGLRFHAVDVVVARFRAGGLSDMQRINSILGWWSVVRKKTLVNFFYLFILSKEVLKGLVKNFAN
ncbi:glycosyltransferase family 2 protein [Marinobacter shengliensis]